MIFNRHCSTDFVNSCREIFGNIISSRSLKVIYLLQLGEIFDMITLNGTILTDFFHLLKDFIGHSK